MTLRVEMSIDLDYLKQSARTRKRQKDDTVEELAAELEWQLRRVEQEWRDISGYLDTS